MLSALGASRDAGEEDVRLLVAAIRHTLAQDTAPFRYNDAGPGRMPSPDLRLCAYRTGGGYVLEVDDRDGVAAHIADTETELGRTFGVARLFERMDIICDVAPIDFGGRQFELDMWQIVRPLQAAGLTEWTGPQLASSVMERAAAGLLIAPPVTVFVAPDCRATLKPWGCDTRIPGSADPRLLWTKAGALVSGPRSADIEEAARYADLGFTVQLRAIGRTMSANHLLIKSTAIAGGYRR